MSKRDDVKPYCCDEGFGRDVEFKSAWDLDPKRGPSLPEVKWRTEPTSPAPPACPFADLVRSECRRIEAMLVEKNAAYGNSALDPVRIFSQADRLEQLKVRIDDKLSRIAKGHAAGEEVVGDLIGYLVLLRIAERKA